MGRFIDCQLALLSWGQKAKYRRARVGLLRKGSIVFIALYFNPTDSIMKFEIHPDEMELMPAAIRLKSLSKDIFIRQVSDGQRYATMLREIRVILKRDKYTSKQSGKSQAFEQLISKIPPMSTYIARNPTATQVSRLTLTNINLTEVPQQIVSLSSSLQYLDLSNNRIEKLPKSFCCKMTKLKELNLHNNKLDNLPRSFCCRMTNLEHLDLSNNLIRTLPIEIKFFRRLRDLNMSHNHLRMLPSTFSDLRSLRKLDVSNNNLSQLPAFRGYEIRLEVLDVSYNPLDGASNGYSTFEVHPLVELDDHDNSSLGYQENRFNPLLGDLPSTLHSGSRTRVPRLFDIAMLKVVRSDRLLKLASEERLPRTIVSTMQRDIFKCYKCGIMNILPAYNSTDILDYIDQVIDLYQTGNYRHGMTFMKLICRTCFDKMSS